MRMPLSVALFRLNENFLFYSVADVDDCNTPGANNCSSNTDCVNKLGSFECNCKIGYTGDGVSCNGRFLTPTTQFSFFSCNVREV